MLEKPGFYVEPTIVTGLAHDAEIVQRESFVPVLYVVKCKVKDYLWAEQTVTTHSSVDLQFSNCDFSSVIILMSVFGMVIYV